MKDSNADKYKEASKNNWRNAPCGSNLVDIKNYIYLSKEYFDELEKQKRKEEPWKIQEFGKMNIKNKKVLEIGYGMGCDHLELARRGAILSGIDITKENLKIAKKHLELNGYSSNLIIGDAEKMPYENNSFDFVYSFGVLHHTPNMEKSIHEIYRVLKPGGRVWIAVYNKNSWFYRYYIIPKYFIKKEFMKISLAERLSLIEYPNTNKDILVRLTSKKELKLLFNKFEIDEIKTRSLNNKSFLFGGKLLGDKTINIMSRYWGWYNIISAHKVGVSNDI